MCDTEPIRGALRPAGSTRKTEVTWSCSHAQRLWFLRNVRGRQVLHAVASERRID